MTASSPTSKLARKLAFVLFGIDPVPLSLDAAYSQLKATCLRDHPTADCMLTADGLYAYFSIEGCFVEASVIVTIDRRSTLSEHKTSVGVNVTGTAWAADLDTAACVVDDAFEFANCCRRLLRQWGRL